MPHPRFRDFGFFIYCSKWCTLQGDDDQFCPCPEDLWRSFVLNGPRTQESANAVQREICKQSLMKPDEELTDEQFEENKKQVEIVISAYEQARD